MGTLVGGARVTATRHIAEPPAYSLTRYVEHIMTNPTCSVDGCSKPRKPESRMCSMHCGRLYRYGRLDLIRRPNGTGNINAAGYIDGSDGGRRTYEHIRVAETALGKRLPPKACVHHVDENRQHNANGNLVICPNDSYHKLLHRRMKALDACGNANWRLCTHCRQYDDPARLRTGVNGWGAWHLECRRAANRQRYQRRTKP